MHPMHPNSYREWVKFEGISNLAVSNVYQGIDDLDYPINHSMFRELIMAMLSL